MGYLQEKNFTQIMSDLIDRILLNTHELNDFSPGGVIRSILESMATELDMYYILQRRNIKRGIELGVYEAFGFTRREPRKAYGELLIELNTASNTDTIISRGNTFHSNIQGYNQVYETLEDFVIPAGQSRAIVKVYATTAGTAGNVPKNVINSSPNSVHNIRSITNPYAFLTGQNQEPLDSVKQRFREFVETRGRATDRAIAYGTRLVEDISGVYVESQVGRVNVYAHDLNGNLSDDLKRQVERSIRNYRPSGIRLDVHPIERLDVDLDIEVIIRDKTAKTEVFRQEIHDKVTHYLNSKEVSDDLILTSVIRLIKNMDDYLIYDVRIRNKTENTYVDSNQLIRAGSVSITLV